MVVLTGVHVLPAAIVIAKCFLKLFALPALKLEKNLLRTPLASAQ